MLGLEIRNTCILFHLDKINKNLKLLKWEVNNIIMWFATKKKIDFYYTSDKPINMYNNVLIQM